MISKVSHADLYHLLVTNEWNVTRAALSFGCNRSALYRRMKRIGMRNLKSQPGIRKTQLEVLMDKYHRNINKVAAEMGYHKTWVYKKLKEWNIPLASRSQKWRKLGLTHCKHGHAFDLKNTYMHGNGSKSCRKCNSINSLKRYYFKKGSKNVQPIRHEHAGETLSDMLPPPSADTAVQVRHAGEDEPHDEVSNSYADEGQQGSRRDCPSLPENHSGPDAGN